MLGEGFVGLSGSNGDVEFGDDAVESELLIATDVVADFLAVHFAHIEMALQTDAVDRDVTLLESLGQVVEGFRFGVALEFAAVFVEDEAGVRVGTMCIDECRVDEVLANHLRPHRLFAQVVGIRIVADAGLVVVETFVHHVPFRDFALEVGNYGGDMLLQNLEQLGTCPVLVILLAIGGNPWCHL